MTGPRQDHGYALFIVLTFLLLLLVLSAAFSMTLQLGGQESRTIQAESAALAAADAGIQYGLEAVRLGPSAQAQLAASPADAAWIFLADLNGLSVCFKVFAQSPCGNNQFCVGSYGEAVKGGCGDYSGALSRIVGARALSAGIDLTQMNVANWQEASFP